MKDSAFKSENSLCYKSCRCSAFLLSTLQRPINMWVWKRISSFWYTRRNWNWKVVVFEGLLQATQIQQLFVAKFSDLIIFVFDARTARSQICNLRFLILYLRMPEVLSNLQRKVILMKYYRSKRYQDRGNKKPYNFEMHTSPLRSTTLCLIIQFKNLVKNFKSHLENDFNYLKLMIFKILNLG